MFFFILIFLLFALWNWHDCYQTSKEIKKMRKEQESLTRIGNLYKIFGGLQKKEKSSQP